MTRRVEYAEIMCTHTIQRLIYLFFCNKSPKPSSLEPRNTPPSNPPKTLSHHTFSWSVSGIVLHEQQRLRWAAKCQKVFSCASIPICTCKEFCTVECEPTNIAPTNSIVIGTSVKNTPTHPFIYPAQNTQGTVHPESHQARKDNERVPNHI
jgi:hypothetical protein